MHQNSKDEIDYILKNYKTIAVVGLSKNVYRPSHDIAQYLLRNNYKVIPVNPGYSEVLGLKCYKSLLDIPEEVEVVNIFRRSDQVVPIVEQAVAVGAKAVWMQLGVYNEQAATIARNAGLMVIMDSCIKIEHAIL